MQRWRGISSFKPKPLQTNTYGTVKTIALFQEAGEKECLIFLIVWKDFVNYIFMGIFVLFIVFLYGEGEFLKFSPNLLKICHAFSFWKEMGLKGNVVKE